VTTECSTVRDGHRRGASRGMCIFVIVVINHETVADSVTFGVIISVINKGSVNGIEIG
jgi:hypothetical protein